MNLRPHTKTIIRNLLGDPNEGLSTKEQWRYGSKGSLAVEIAGEKAGSWFDHEAGEGGGMLDLVRREKGFSNGTAFAWLRSELGIGDGPNRSGARYKITGIWVYRDRDCTPLYRVVRRDCEGKPKKIHQERYDAITSRYVSGKGSMKCVRLVPYRLPDWIQVDGTLLIPEGEKHCDRLFELGFLATCNPMGAGKWRRNFGSQYFSARYVVLLPDNDRAGRDHVAQIAANLQPVAASVKILELPGLEPKGDVVDWLDAGGTAEKLRKLIEAAPDAAELTARWDVSRQPEPDHRQAALGDAPFDFSHDGLALDLGRQWQHEARHVALWGRWLFWTGARWEPDERLTHMTRTRDYLRRRADSLVKATAARGPIDGLDVDKAEALAKQLRSAPTVANVIGLARSNAELVATCGQWDAGPRLLGTPAGTVDLRTGTLRAANPEDYITKCTAVPPAPAGTAAPIWQGFLERIFRHDPELVPFVQRALGYSLLGAISDHVLLFCWGQGGNGKGVLLNTAARILGDYAAIAPSDLLLVTQSERHPCDMAMLRGARMVTAQELAPGRTWDEPKLKSLTGGDPITARFMRQDFFTYEPQFTLWVAGNHKPSFKGVDEAIRRRVLLVPFLQVIPQAERDTDLPDKLTTEWPAILRWMIDGCLAYQREGLKPPASALAATKDYLDAEDLLGQWLEERCVVHPQVGWTALKSLYADWCAWAGERGHAVYSPGAWQAARRARARAAQEDKRHGVS